MGAKDAMNLGDRVVLPVAIHEFSEEKKPEIRCTEEEVAFLNSLVVHKVIFFVLYRFFGL